MRQIKKDMEEARKLNFSIPRRETPGALRMEALSDKTLNWMASAECAKRLQLVLKTSSYH